MVSHLKSDVEISCLPKDLPEALEVDMAGMSLNDTMYLKDIKLPPGVTIPELAAGSRHAGGVRSTRRVRRSRSRWQPKPPLRLPTAGRCEGGCRMRRRRQWQAMPRRDAKGGKK